MTKLFRRIILETLARNEAGVVLTKSTQHKPAGGQSWKKQFDSQTQNCNFSTPWYTQLFTDVCWKHSPGRTVLVSSCSDFLVCTAQKWETSDLRKWHSKYFLRFLQLCARFESNTLLWWGFETLQIFAVYTLVVHGTTCTIQWINVTQQHWWLWWWWWW